MNRDAVSVRLWRRAALALLDRDGTGAPIATCMHCAGSQMQKPLV